MEIYMLDDFVVSRVININLILLCYFTFYENKNCIQFDSFSSFQIIKIHKKSKMCYHYNIKT